MSVLPLVSIVTPTLDRVEFLRRTTTSITQQTYPNIEHIVIDGGSTDGTQKMLAQLEREYALRWLSEPDDGMYSAINKGLGMARGDIVAYLNSDDLYFPWSVEVVVAAFEAHPEADFVYGDALSVDDETGRQQPYWMYPPNADYLKRVGIIAQPSVFWRRSAMEALGPFDESLKYVADCDYWMRATASHTFVKVNEFLSVERDHTGTIRESQAPILWPELDMVRSRYVKLSGPPTYG